MLLLYAGKVYSFVMIATITAVAGSLPPPLEFPGVRWSSGNKDVANRLVQRSNC